MSVLVSENVIHYLRIPCQLLLSTPLLEYYSGVFYAAGTLKSVKSVKFAMNVD